MAISDFFNNKSKNEDQDDNITASETDAVTITNPEEKSDDSVDIKNDIPDLIITEEVTAIIPPELPTPDEPKSENASDDFFTSSENESDDFKAPRPSLDFKTNSYKPDHLIEASEIDGKLEAINGRFSNAVEELVTELKKELAELDDKIEQQKLQTQAAEEESERLKARIETLEAA